MTKKSDLFMVKFANGTKEVMRAEPVVQQQPETYTPRPFTPRKPRVMDQQAVFALIASIASIILGIVALSMVDFAVALPFLILSLVAAIVAVVLAKRAMNRIREQPDIYKGKGLAIPASIMGWIMIGIFALMLIILALAFLLI
jgi:hypothetical protein